MPSLAESLGKELKTILIFVGVIWAVFLASCLVPGVAHYGLTPRTLLGLLGIITMPFLHGSLGHLVANTIPLIVLLLLLSGSRANSWVIVLEITVLGGVLLWICGLPANHIGASALISGLITFLVLGGYFERRPIPIVVAIITFVLYGSSLLWGLIPRDKTVSWDGHLCGAIAGGLLAFQLARWAKPRANRGALHTPKPALIPVLVLALWTPSLCAQDSADTHNVQQYGAKGDGTTDATLAFQQALDAAGQAGGGVVYAPRGNYRFAGHLNVPNNVTLKGVWESVPAHNGIRDRGLPKPTDDGTTFLVSESRGAEEGPPFLTLNTNSTLKGVVIYYPDQQEDEVPAPYPWAIAMRGKNPAVLDVELLNPYNGIDASRNERHLIRNVHGQPLRRGILVDAIYDIGRIENAHFNPWWSMRPKLAEWQRTHGEAFVFGRSDWQYVLNTFCFGYSVGYKFIQSDTGTCNGNFLGIGADACHTAVLVEQSAPYGILITNGQFVSFRGEDPTMVVVDAKNRGSVRFVNCSFWGPCHQIARIAGRGTVGLSDCTFCDWDAKREGRAAIQVGGGTVLIRGCEFQQEKPCIRLEADVQGGVVAGNIFRTATPIADESGGRVAISGNSEIGKVPAELPQQ
ncbi:MAG: rhomboid family intramembrane serine protease [Pirellulaceae bacterium]